MVVDAGSVAKFAALLGEPTRATMCLALIDGRAWTRAELAAHADVARSTASEHVTALSSPGSSPRNARADTVTSDSPTPTSRPSSRTSPGRSGNPPHGRPLSAASVQRATWRLPAPATTTSPALSA